MTVVARTIKDGRKAARRLQVRLDRVAGNNRRIGALGTDEFLRIRLGIAPERKITDGVKFVLTPFRKSQLKTVDEVIEKAAEARAQRRADARAATSETADASGKQTPQPLAA